MLTEIDKENEKLRLELVRLQKELHVYQKKRRVPKSAKMYQKLSLI